MTVVEGLKKNVYLTNIFTGLDGISQGIWGMAVLGPYLKALADNGDPTKTNSYVGYAEGIQGMCQALSALPAGILADKIGRAKMMKISSIFGLVAVAIILYALQFDHGFDKEYDGVHNPDWYKKFCVMTCGLAFWGCYQGLYSPSLLSIYSDSVQSGNRSKYETIRFVVQVIANASGPLLNVVLFLTVGDNWSFYNMSRVFSLGIVIAIAPILLLNFFKETLNTSDDQGESSPLVEEQEQQEEKAKQVALQMLADIDANRTWYQLPTKVVPGIIVLGDIIFGLASGMTIKFFPLFFKSELLLKPAIVNGIYMAGPLVMSVFCIACTKLSIKFGRMETVIGTNVIGIMLLTIMGLLRPVWLSSPHLIAAIYIIRTGVMNCTTPLTRSVLMDFAVENRGFWNSLDSVCMFGWSGSAAIGGVLVDKYGYGYTFYFTAALQFIGCMVQASLIPIVPTERESIAQQSLKVCTSEYGTTDSSSTNEVFNYGTPGDVQFGQVRDSTSSNHMEL